MTDLLAHLQANAAQPAQPPAAEPEPTIEELEAYLAANPADTDAAAYLAHRRAAQPAPTRLADLPPPLVVDLDPAQPEPDTKPTEPGARDVAEVIAEHDAKTGWVKGSWADDPTVAKAHEIDAARSAEPAQPPPAKRGRPRKDATPPAPVQPTYDRVKASREIIAVECIRRGLSIDDAAAWSAFVEGGS